jgi:hypothetical protein
MTLEQANKIFAEVAEGRIRWGKLFDLKNVGEGRVLDAIATLAKHENHEVTELKRALLTSQKQLGMAKAREKGLRNRLESQGVDPDKVAGQAEEDHDD